jgi:hypothetical protein
LRSRRIWLAAAAVVAASWLVAALTGFFLRGLQGQVHSLWPEHGRSASSMLFLVGGMLSAAGVEAGKVAALSWVCARRWEEWAPLGVAFGALKAVGVLVS